MSKRPIYSTREEPDYLMTGKRPSTKDRWILGIFLATLLFGGLWWVWEAEGQVKQDGVGLPGVPRPDFHHSWCEQKRPPGRQATCTAKAPTGFDCRLCPANGWNGYYAEFYQRTTAAMRGAWEANFWGTRTTHDGAVVQSSEPTPGVLAAEFSWVEITYPRTHEIYRRFWYEGPDGGPGGGGEGGTEAAPILINPNTLRFNVDRIDCIKALGAWPAPGATGSYVGFDPVYPADVCANRFPPPGARPLWSVWVKNALPADHPVNGGSVPPPPPPPAPVPSPPPTVTPCPPSRLENCAGLKSPFGQPICSGCPCPESMPPREKEYHCTPQTAPPPRPPPTCEECAVGGYRDPRCAPCPCPPEMVDAGLPLQPLPGRHCTPRAPIESCIQCDMEPFRPGIPSTGVSGWVVQLVCRWVDCPEVMP